MRQLPHLLGAGNARTEGLDMNIDPRARIRHPLDFLFELAGTVMRFAKARVFVHLEMQLDKEVSIVMVSRKLVNGEAATLGDGANRFKNGFVVRPPRLDVNNDVGGGDNSFDILLDRVACGMGLFEAG